MPELVYPTAKEKLDVWFTYHPPKPEDLVKYTNVRDAAKTFAECLVHYCPDSADLSAAIRKSREAVMTANAAIACGGE